MTADTSKNFICGPAIGYSEQRALLKSSARAGFSFLLTDFSIDIIDVIAQHNRIVLLGDAGVGKTTELQRIRDYFSKAGSPFAPFFVPLNRYVDESIPQLLGPTWTAVPKNQVLIVMDGLDEIEAKNRNDAIRRIESFSEQYPSTKIIISCRKNFYMMEKEGESGTLSGFSSYILLDLDDNDIEKYLQNKLGDQTEVFRKAILAKQLHALLRVPFYLISLVTLFLTSQYKLFITHKQKKKLKPNLIASKESQAETLYLVTLSEANGTR